MRALKGILLALCSMFALAVVALPCARAGVTFTGDSRLNGAPPVAPAPRVTGTLTNTAARGFTSDALVSSIQRLDGATQIEADLFGFAADYAPLPGGPTNAWSGGLSPKWDITGANLISGNVVLKSVPAGRLLGGHHHTAAQAQGTLDDAGGSIGAIDAIPEPDTYATLLATLGVIVWIARRRTRSAYA